MFCLLTGMHLAYLSASLPEVPPLQFRLVALSWKQYFLCPALTTHSTLLRRGPGNIESSGKLVVLSARC